MLGDIENRVMFPAPTPSYGPQSYKRHLCWIPWNEEISPERKKDPGCTDGIPALWFTAPRAANVILFFHANAEDLGMLYKTMKHLSDQFKVNVLAVEYPGYGVLSKLQPSEEAVYEVALTAFRFLFDEVKFRYSQIFLFGRSLGSGPAVHLASQYPVGGLILVSPFSSIRGAVRSIAGSLFALGVKERFPNLQIIINVSCPTLIIHGEADRLIPVEHSLRLFERCRARKLLVTPPTMEHNTNFFAKPSYLVEPAIHFFGFPGFRTAKPPRLPAHLFEKSRKPPVAISEDERCARQGFCGYIAVHDRHNLDVSRSISEHIICGSLAPRAMSNWDHPQHCDITISFNDREAKKALQVENAPPALNLSDLEISSGTCCGCEQKLEKAKQNLDMSKENIEGFWQIDNKSSLSILSASKLLDEVIKEFSM